MVVHLGGDEQRGVPRAQRARGGVARRLRAPRPRAAVRARGNPNRRGASRGRRTHVRDGFSPAGPWMRRKTTHGPTRMPRAADSESDDPRVRHARPRCRRSTKFRSTTRPILRICCVLAGGRSAVADTHFFQFHARALGQRRATSTDGDHLLALALAVVAGSRSPSCGSWRSSSGKTPVLWDEALSVAEAAADDTLAEVAKHGDEGRRVGDHLRQGVRLVGVRGRASPAGWRPS